MEIDFFQESLECLSLEIRKKTAGRCSRIKNQLQIKKMTSLDEDFLQCIQNSISASEEAAEGSNYFRRAPK